MTHPTPAATPSASSPPRGAGLGLGGVLLALALTSQATAQVIPTGTPAADILLSQAIADQRVFLTCTALDPDTHKIALDFWAADVAAAVTLLQDHKVAPEAIAAFQAAAAPKAMMPPADTPFAEVSEFCLAQDRWSMHWMRRDFTELAARLPEAFE